MLLALQFLSLIISASGLVCYKGSLVNVNTEYSFTTIEEATCSDGVTYCANSYLNDGFGTTIVMACGDEFSCKAVGCQFADTNAKECCCQGDRCNSLPAEVEKDAHEFPADFKFSSATSAFQVEGATLEDGRGLSSWDTFSRIPGVIKDNSTADIACDTYHKYKEDVQLMKGMNVQQYRFSISWSRIFPDGTNTTVNTLGVQYYHNLINELVNNGIEPVGTMFHWDMPQALMDQGGFLNPKIVDWFGDYAEFLFSEYGSQIKMWIPLNELLSMAQFEYCGDTHADAPGEFKFHCAWSMYLAGHHMLLAHARAWQIYRDKFLASQKGMLGVSLCGEFFLPLTSNQEDIDAAERAMQFSYGWFANPVFNGDYPELMKKTILARSVSENRTKSRLPEFTDAEKLLLNGSAQFIGLNYYTGSIARARKPDEYTYGTPIEWLDGEFVRSVDPTWKQISVPNGWIYNTPFALRGSLKFLRDNYANPKVLMTENGCMDAPGEDLHDVSRINYLRSHLMALAEAVKQDGCQIIGHTLWSLMDNFEWLDGFATKFGGFRVDFSSPNRTRTPKDSIGFYTEAAKNRAVYSL